MAEALSVTQGQVAKWEGKKQTPPGQVFAALARIAPEDEQAMWLEMAGVKVQAELPKLTRTIPILRDAAAAGTPRAIDESEIEETLAIPQQWLGKGGAIYGVRIQGESMSPILESGFLVLIDVARRDPKYLAGKMVAARNGDGVTVKWLRKQSDDLYLLVPQNTAPQFPIVAMQAGDGWSIVGEIVMWLGTPDAVRK